MKYFKLENKPLIEMELRGRKSLYENFSDLECVLMALSNFSKIYLKK